MRALPILGAVLVACSGDGADSASTDTAADTTGPGTFLVSFEIETDLFKSMPEEARGTFRGSLYAEEGASAVGPVDGHDPLENLSVTLDLTSGSAADAWTSMALESGIYWILGCLDTDDNDCDAQDPITIPNENKFLLEGQATPATIQLNMLNPG